MTINVIEWYEAIRVGGFGCRLSDVFTTKEDAEKGIEEANARAVSLGYKAEEFFIVLCHRIRKTDDNGDVISETTTMIRV